MGSLDPANCNGPVGLRLACVNGVEGETCGGPNYGGRGVRVTCAPLSPPALPPLPPPYPSSPPTPLPSSVWGAVQSSGAAAFTDGAVGGCDGGVKDSSVFWGFRSSASGNGPDYGGGCSRANGTLIGTPCAPGVPPSKRYNLLLVRAGSHAHAGRVGLAMRRWRFDRDDEALNLYDRAALLPQAGYWTVPLGDANGRLPGHDPSKCLDAGVFDEDCIAYRHNYSCADGYTAQHHRCADDVIDGQSDMCRYSCTAVPHWFQPFQRKPWMSDAFIADAYPLHSKPELYRQLPTPLLVPQYPDQWMGNKKWLQSSIGWFVPPVDGDYLFSVWTRSADKGTAYLVLSSGPSPAGAYVVAWGNHWHDQVLSRWLPLVAGKMYYFEFWHDYLAPDGWHGTGGTSVAVRLATTNSDGVPIHIPPAVRDLGVAESGTATCKESDRDEDTCFTGGTAGSGLLTNQQGWRHFDLTWAERGLDWMWRPNYLFDPMPPSFLRHSGRKDDVETLHAGGRGALRKWWGWADGKCLNPGTGATFLEEAWSFPWADQPGQTEPRLLNASLPPNGTEPMTEIATPRTPEFKGLQCYAEVISTYFRPKRTARYAFKLWNSDHLWARLYFNPLGPEPAGAVDAAASRSTRFRDRHQPSDHWDDRCRACAGRARTAFYDLQAGQLYFMRIFHAASEWRAKGRSSLRLTLVMTPPSGSNRSTWSPPTRPPNYYDKKRPCEVSGVDPRAAADSNREAGEHEIDLVDDSWLVMPHVAPQVALQVGETIARCDTDAPGGCVVPDAAGPATGSERRQLRQAEEEGRGDTEPDAAPPIGLERRDVYESSLDAGMQSSVDDVRPPGNHVLRSSSVTGAPALMARAEADVTDEDDDHIQHHPEAELIPDLEAMHARTPLRVGEAPIQTLRREQEEMTTTHPVSGGGAGRRLSTQDAPLRWSDSATWGGDAPPNNTNTQIVFIPNGTHLLLDVPFVHVRVWVIEGSLALADEMDVELGAEAIIINHGELHVGSSSAPFAHAATFTLHGHWQSPQLPIFGIKLIGLTKGKIFMHGQPRTSFLRLAAPAVHGSTSLTLDSVPVGWQAGDALVVTSSTHDVNCTMLRNDACQTEEVTLAAIDGAAITLEAPLAYTHSVQAHHVDNRSVFLTCEVVNLNRNGVGSRAADAILLRAHAIHVCMWCPCAC